MSLRCISRGKDGPDLDADHHWHRVARHGKRTKVPLSSPTKKWTSLSTWKQR